jgi:hypothetical protein
MCSFKGDFSKEKEYISHDILLFPFFQKNYFENWQGIINKEEIPEVLNMESIWYEINDKLLQNFSWNEDISILEKKIMFKKQFNDFKKSKNTSLEDLFLMKDLIQHIKKTDYSPKKDIIQMYIDNVDKMKLTLETMIEIFNTDYNIQLKLG